MAEYNKTILTNQGLELMRKANAGQAKFTITKVAGSSENLSSKNQEEIKKLTSITDVKQMGTIKDIEGSSLDPNTVAALKLTFDNRNLAQAYDLNTVAIYAKEEGKEEFLYAVSTAKSAEHFPSFSNKVLFTFEVLLYLVIGQIDNVTVNVSPEKVEEELKKTKEELENRTYTKQEIDTKVAQAGKVKTVNHIEPDLDGNISIDPQINVVNSYDFNTGSATGEYRKLSQAHAIGREVLDQIKDKLTSTKADLEKEINNDITPKLADKVSKADLNTAKNDLISQLDSKASKTDLNTAKNDLEKDINSKVSQTDFNALKSSVVKSVKGVHPDAKGNVAITEYGKDANGLSAITEDYFSNTLQMEIGKLKTNEINIPSLMLISSIAFTAAQNNDNVLNLQDQQDKTNEQLKATNTNVTSNTNRIKALENKETSHISANETDALNYSKAHPGIPVFVTE